MTLSELCKLLYLPATWNTICFTIQTDYDYWCIITTVKNNWEQIYTDRGAKIKHYFITLQSMKNYCGVLNGSISCAVARGSSFKPRGVSVICQTASHLLLHIPNHFLKRLEGRGVSHSRHAHGVVQGAWWDWKRQSSHLCQSPGDDDTHTGQRRGRHLACIGETLPGPHVYIRVADVVQSGRSSEIWGWSLDFLPSFGQVLFDVTERTQTQLSPDVCCIVFFGQKHLPQGLNFILNLCKFKL